MRDLKGFTAMITGAGKNIIVDGGRTLGPGYR